MNPGSVSDIVVSYGQGNLYDDDDGEEDDDDGKAQSKSRRDSQERESSLYEFLEPIEKGSSDLSGGYIKKVKTPQRQKIPERTRMVELMKHTIYSNVHLLNKLENHR